MGIVFYLLGLNFLIAGCIFYSRTYFEKISHQQTSKRTRFKQIGILLFTVDISK